MHNTTNLRERAVRGLSAFGLVAGLLLGLVAAPASTRASAAFQSNPPATFTVPAGGTATINVRGFCMDFGKPFPTGDTTPNGLAPANVRAALNYAIGKGYTDSNAAQVELAVWFLRDNTWHVNEHTLGTEIATNATAAPPSGTGTSLVDAIAQNQVTVTAKFVPQTADHFYGDAQAVIRNSGTADLQLYMPVGTVFSAGSGSNFQNLAAYALSNQPAQATGTVAATVSPGLTATTVVTGTASPALTVSPAVTGTVVTTATVATSPTSVGTVVAETPTGAATVAATSTTEVAPATAEPTATTAAVETPTAVPGSGVLPQTGGSDGGSTILLAVLLTVVALLAVGSGAALAHKHRA